RRALRLLPRARGRGGARKRRTAVLLRLVRGLERRNPLRKRQCPHDRLQHRNDRFLDASVIGVSRLKRLLELSQAAAGRLLVVLQLNLLLLALGSASLKLGAERLPVTSTRDFGRILLRE